MNKNQKFNAVVLSLSLIFSATVMAESNMHDECQWCLDDGVCIPCDIGVLPK